MSLNATKLAEGIANKFDLSVTKAKEIVKDVFEGIQDELTDGNGDGAAIHGFGTFTVVERAARTARNPTTGEPIQVPAKRTVKFKPAKALKDALA